MKTELRNELVTALYNHVTPPLQQPMEKHGITFALGLVLGFVLALLMVATDVHGAY